MERKYHSQSLDFSSAAASAFIKCSSLPQLGSNDFPRTCPRSLAKQRGKQSRLTSVHCRRRCPSRDLGHCGGGGDDHGIVGPDAAGAGARREAVAARWKPAQPRGQQVEEGLGRDDDDDGVDGWHEENLLLQQAEKGSRLHDGIHRHLDERQQIGT